MDPPTCHIVLRFLSVAFRLKLITDPNYQTACAAAVAKFYNPPT